MTFSHIGNGLYTCLAADTKVTTGMTTNSICIETDTGTLFAFASGAWSAVGGGGGGAPTTASYVTLGTNATLTSERVLTAGTDIALTDAGAGSTLTVDIGTNVITTSNTKTLTNKTIAAGSNTITGIVDANITAHTTSKITTSSKSLLNSAIVYNDQTNTFGAFDQILPSSRLKIQNPGATFNYIIAGSAIAADRTVTLPLLTANDTLVTLAFGQTLTNKTIDASANTVSNIVDANIGTHTTTKITTSSKSLLNSAIVYNDQTNSFGDFNQVFKDNRLLINNPADTFAYTIIGAAIAANRNITLPLLTGNDVMATEAFTQTFTNKTLDTATNTITGIADANITAHTSTKVTITAKGQLNSSIVYTDQANTLGDFNFTLKDNRLLINNPADTFNYTIIAAAIAANRSITLPLLTGNDVMVTEAFTQTLTNKTMSGASNTFSNIPYTALTSIPSTIVKTDQTNTYGAFAQIFPSSQLKIQNPGATFNYIIAGSALAADRTLTLPLLTGNDVAVTEAFSQTLTNKTITAGSNTISGIADANITAHTSTKITITAKGQLNSTILYNDTDNTLNAHFLDITKMTAPASPAVNDLRLYVDTTDTHLKHKNNGGTVIDLTAAAAGGGEANTYSNAGVGGIGVTLTKSGVDLPFKSVKANSTKVAVTDGGGNNNVLVDVNDANLSIAYSQLTSVPSTIVKTDQTQTFGAFDQIFPSTRLKLKDATTPANYIFATSAIAADRTVTLPLLTGNDTFAMLAFAQTLTNKTIDATNNTISNIADSNIGTHTTTKITTTSKSLLNSAIVYNDQANVYGDFLQTIRSSRLKIMNPLNSFGYVFVGSAIITADKNITIPLLTGNDVMVMEAFAQTLTNKTIVAGSNTITGIVDANITAHTTSKITTTTKSLLNSALVYNDQTNTFGAFNQIFPSTRLRINDSTTPANYIIATSAIAADRTITLPLMTGNDVMALLDFAQTFTNKTIAAGSNTITGLVDANIGTHTTTKITTTSKSLLNTAIVYNDADNAMGAHYIDITKMTAPSNPGSANDLRLYVDTADTHLKHRNSAGTVVDITAATGGGGGDATLSGTQTFTGAKSFDLQVALKEIAAPSSPAAGYQALYIDSTSHKLNRKNSSGTVTQIEPQFTEAKGVSTQTQSSASNTGFTIAHGLGSSPSWVSCTGSSVDSDSDFSYTSDSTNITVTYPFPPPTGSSNITFQWRVTA